MRNSNWLPAGSKNRPALPGKTEPLPVPYVIAQPESYSAAEEGSVNVADYARTLWRRKGTLLLIVLLGVLAGAGISALQPHIYQSLATVEVQAVPGEMQDPTAEESAPAEGAEAATPESGKEP